jgi:hypothetical protein
MTINSQVVATKLYLKDEKLLKLYLNELELLYGTKNMKRIHVMVSKMKKYTQNKS